MSFSDSARNLWTWTRFVLAALAGAYLLLLVILNFGSVPVRYLFGTLEIPLALVILLSGLIGAGVYAIRHAILELIKAARGQFAAYMAARAARQAAAAPATPPPAGASPSPAAAATVTPPPAPAANPAPSDPAPIIELKRDAGVPIAPARGNEGTK
jgi:uncharacterized integral membrane protein